MKSPHTTQLNPHKTWQSKKFSTVNNNNINTFFNSYRKAPAQPKPQVISHIIKEVSGYDFLAHVRNMQITAGYQPDTWGLSTLNQLAHSGNGLNLVIQSLAFGNRSIVTLPKPIAEVEIADIKQYMDNYNSGKLPPGISSFFTSVHAYSATNLIHDKYLKETDEHYHNFTQVAAPRCKKSGRVLFSLRQTLGIFNIPDYLGEIPIAVSEVQANSNLTFRADNGEVYELELGKGGVIQIVVPLEALPFIHHYTSRIIYQQDNKHGIEKAVLKENNQTIEWVFRGHETQHDEQLIVDPEGIASLRPR